MVRKLTSDISKLELEKEKILYKMFHENNKLTYTELRQCRKKLQKIAKDITTKEKTLERIKAIID